MKNKLKRAFGVLLLLAALVIYFYPDYGNWKMRSKVKQLETVYMQQKEQTGQPQKTEEAPKPDEEVSDEEASKKETSNEGTSNKVVSEPVLSEMQIRLAEMEQYNQNLKEQGQKLQDAWSYEQPPVGVQWPENTPIGYIEIPAMCVELPLYLGASTENMEQGAAVMSQTSMPIGGIDTNCVVVGHRGHNGIAFFLEIERLDIDDMVRVVTQWGTLIYRVKEMSIIQPEDIDAVLIQPGKDMLTLLTCHPYLSGGRERYVVYCERDLTQIPETQPTPVPNTPAPQSNSPDSVGSDAAEPENTPQTPENTPQTAENTPQIKPKTEDSSVSWITAERVIHFGAPVMVFIGWTVWKILTRKKKNKS